MKSFKMLVMAAFSIITVSAFAQDTTKQKMTMKKHHMEQVKYNCPMHADITSDKAGKCSKCGMDLTKSTMKHSQMEGMKMYSCPMKCEGDKTYDKAGKCPSCGMNLKEKMKASVVYACPMKCEGDKTYDKAGSCSKCGMDLTEVKNKSKKD